MLYFQVKNNKVHILSELETALTEQTPPAQQENPNLHELPHLVVDGIPTPVDKMTQVCVLGTSIHHSFFAVIISWDTSFKTPTLLSGPLSPFRK